MIKLRGHHLETLRNYIRAHINGEDPQTDRKYADEYGDEFVDKRIALFGQLIQNPQTKILLVANEFDILCNNDCKLKEPDCIKPLGWDEYTAQSYGYVIGRTYTIDEIISEVRRTKKV
jgi:hypothetical protein